MDIPTVSVIIPLYNAQETIERCIESVIRQQLKRIEIIIINDGSIDSSEYILKDYASQDNRIKLMSLEKNMGVSNAREIGICNAKGDYIAFLDSDDWCEESMYSTLFDIASSSYADIVMSDAYCHLEDKCIRIANYTRSDGLYSYIDFYNTFYLPLYGRLSQDENISGYVWSSIFKRELFDELLSFKGIMLYEDEIMLLQLLHNSEHIYLCREPLYNYDCTRGGSLSRKDGYHKGYWENAVSVTLAKERIAQLHNIEENEYKHRLANYLFKSFIAAVGNESKEDNLKSLHEINTYLSVIATDKILDEYYNVFTELNSSLIYADAIINRKDGGLQELYQHFIKRDKYAKKLKEFSKDVG